jgi:N-acyl homoserine lactone hydrolase
MNKPATKSCIALAGSLVAAAALTGCLPSSHPVTPGTLGVPRSSAELEAALREPGPVTVETVVGADWQVPRSGLLNLDHPTAEAAHLKDGPEPVQLLFHAVRHPTRGLFIVDTGIERAIHADPDRAAIRGIVASFMNLETMKIRVDTATWLARQREPLSGVLLTHLHLDHVSGMPDVPKGTPIHAGPGELSERSLQNMFVQPSLDRAFEGQGPIRELSFRSDPDGRFEGVLDLFGDRTVWAIHVPGHTPGSTAYLARTPAGPVLMVGDACHTAWGWKHGVEPGSFSSDKPTSARSLARLQRLVQRFPEIEVRLGHQPLERRAAPARRDDRGVAASPGARSTAVGR